MKYKIIAIVSRKSDEKDGGSYGHWLSPIGNKPTAITINKTLIFHQNMNNMDNLQELDDIVIHQECSHNSQSFLMDFT